jgi:hypothetical protein
MTSPFNPNLAPNLPPQGPDRVVYLDAERDPTSSDVKYRDGSYYKPMTHWRNKSSSPPRLWILQKVNSKTDADWLLLGSGSTGNISSINVDAATAPGTDPVVPNTATGEITITGAQVTSGTIGANVIRQNSLAANTFTTQIQQSGASSSVDTTLNGVSHFSSNDFSVTTGFVQANSTKSVGFANLGITLSAGTFSITAANGSALSSTNRGYVTIRSTVTPGTLVTIPITANQSFIDDAGASTIIGNTFGLTSGTAYAQDIPFAIYAVADSTETSINFGISRYWAFTNSPVAGRLGKTGSAVATVTGSIFLFGNPTVANYASQSLLRIGWIRMRMSASDDWTVQTLGVNDGLRLQMIRGDWTFPTGVFGAAVGSYFRDNGGTAPTFDATSTYVYSLFEGGYFSFLINLVAGGADGVGAVEARLTTPFADTSNRVNGIAFGANTGFSEGILVQGAGLAYYSTLIRCTNAAITTNANWVGTKSIRTSLMQIVSVNV